MNEQETELYVEHNITPEIMETVEQLEKEIEQWNF